MIPTRAPADTDGRVQWLVDRAEIGDLMIEFARALDERDWDGYAATYAPDGVLDITPTVQHVGTEGMAAFVAGSLAGYPGGTHHLNTNHAISVDGDTAHARAYLLAAHVTEDLARHADGAGWYDYDLRRTADGWRFTHVRLTIRYVSGEPITH